MNIFVAASYSSKVNYDTGEVLPEYKDWLEEQLAVIEGLGHTVFCSLRADGYKINNEDPAAAYSLDIENIENSDALLAFVADKASAGVQTEIGYALALGKKVALAVEEGVEQQWFNRAIIGASQATAVTLPLDAEAILRWESAARN